MAHALTRALYREEPRDDGPLEAARGIVNSVFFSVVFVWLPILLVVWRSWDR